jgi:hypothetical protein
VPDRERESDREPVVPVRLRGDALVEASLEAPLATEPVIDPVTGLPNLSYLVEQIQELQADERAKLGPRRTVLPNKVLLVVSITGREDRHAALFLGARTASLLRAIFADDESIVLLRQGLFAVLVRDRPDLAADRDFLVSMLADFDVRARVWTERVPADGPTTANLLSSLLLAGDWAGDDN